jgi:hypothetical protein
MDEEQHYISFHFADPGDGVIAFGRLMASTVTMLSRTDLDSHHGWRFGCALLMAARCNCRGDISSRWPKAHDNEKIGHQPEDTLEQNRMVTGLRRRK